MDSEIVCPFCQARCPLRGTDERPFPFEGYGDFEVYRCPCGAVGSASGDIGEAGWPLDDVEAALCRGILQAERGACHMERQEGRSYAAQDGKEGAAGDEP